MANNKWLMWVDWNELGSQYKLYVMDMNTKRIGVICEYSGEPALDTPYLYNDYIAWGHYDYESDVCSIMLYDLNADEVKVAGRFSEPRLYNNFVYMADDKILWTDSIEKKGYYFIYDIKNDVALCFAFL
jgi:hypothetical protein